MVRTYLAYQCLSSMFFVNAVWLYFYRLYITDAQVGILDGLAFTIGLIAEVPSGVLADRFGRGRIARLGLVMTALGLFVQAFGGGFAPFFVGQSIVMIGVSLTSGADEALFFTKINFDRDSAEWRKLVTRGSQFALLGTLGATIVGGWLHTVYPPIPWCLSGLAFIASALLIWRVNETEGTKKEWNVDKNLTGHFKEIWAGFQQFRTPELLRYVPYILTVQALFYTAGWGLLRIVLLDRFHFDPLSGAMIVAVCNIITVASLSMIHRNAQKISEKQMLCTIGLSAAFSLLCAIPDIGAWGFGVIFALYAGDRILYPYLSETLNKTAREEQRATILSIASFFKVLPYVFLAPLIGALNTHGKLGAFLLVWPVLIGAALWFYLAQKKKDESRKAGEVVTELSYDD